MYSSNRVALRRPLAHLFATSAPQRQRSLRGPLATAVFAGTLLALASSPALGAPPSPIELEADQADLDAASGVSIYQGNAVLTRGERRITGDRLEVYTHPEGTLSHIIIFGEPATFRDLPEGEERPLHAEAQRIEYHAAGPERARFEGQAKLWQGEDQITAETIRVNLETRFMEARGNEQQRARTTLYPEQRESE